MICNTTITVLNVRVSSIFQVKEPFLENQLVQVAKLPDPCWHGANCQDPESYFNELYVVGHGDQEVKQLAMKYPLFLCFKRIS